MSSESINSRKWNFAVQMRPLIARYGLIVLSTIGIIVGAVLGLCLRIHNKTWSSARVIMYTMYFGNIFTGMLSTIHVPLLISTIISSVGVLPTGLSARITRTAFIYIIGTSLISMVLSTSTTLIIRPGYDYKEIVVTPYQERFQPNITAVDMMLDILRNLFPSNIVRAWGSHYVTVLHPPNSEPGNETIPSARK